MYVDSAESKFSDRLSIFVVLAREAGEKTNKAATRLRVGGFASHAIIRNGSLQPYGGTPSSFANLRYSLQSMILFVNADISRHILVVDTSVLAKSNMDRRE
jgi:hypothetical protein